MNEKMRILLADDDTEFCARMSAVLDSADDFELVGIAENGEKALSAVNELRPDVLIIELMLPVMDGWSVCAKIRETSKVPIIMLTAKTEDMDKLMGFDHGADDYLTKPFNILELKARIRALLRRAGNQGREAQKRNYLTGGNIKLDLDARNAYKNGELADLTAKEFDVIEFLMRNPNRVYSREALLDTIWAYEYRSDIRTVDVHIRRLREKLEGVSDQWSLKTVWGVGYKFEVSPAGTPG